MSGDRLSAEREQEIRDMLSDPWTAELLAELDAVRADLAQALKERHAIFEASRELAAQCNAAEAALAQARKERDRALLAWGDASAALAAARETLERIAHRSCSGDCRYEARKALSGGGGDPA